MEQGTADESMGEQLFEAVPESTEPTAMEGVVEIQDTAADNKVDDESLKGEYTWTIENWSKIQELKLYSPNFEIGTHLWRLLVCPKGMNAPGQLSVYLDSPEAAFAPANLNPTAGFKLSVLNQKTPGADYFKDSRHKYSSTETDWGFTQFMLLAELMDPDRGFLVDDTVKIKVEINVERDERYYYDSRKETGYVGLKNQGATCYMNSLLQYLYHLPYFRKAVYHMPTNENDEPAASLPLALQSLFYKLQYSRTPVSTKDLTRSFGWSTMDAFTQHDVQELNRVLCEKLEEKMKGTRVEKVITELFEGHTYNFIECVNVDYKSSRRESFMDLQLDVKGCANIYDSFDRYTQVEMMDGENQYKAEGHGLQDARKGVLFDDLPPVLQLQLKRFEYDFQRDTMVKINERYEFFDELDLDKYDGRYLSPSADRSVRNLYKLHSVLVHSGGVHGGHYYAYIRPDGKMWYKFDDTAVTIEDEHKALEDQFGGEDEPTGSPAVKGPLQEGEQQNALAPKRVGPGLKFTKFSNAYMLVYVRMSDWQRYMVQVTKDAIAPYLRDRLEAEQREKERRQKEKQEAHLYCHVRIATDKDIAEQVGSSQWFDLVDYDRLAPSRTFRVRKLTLFSDFKKQVEAEVGVPVDQQRFWVWQQRQNKTYRPTSRLKPDEEKAMIVDLREHREMGHTTAKHALMDLRLYLEIPWPPQSPEQHPGRTEINLFFKYYDPQAETLKYVGHRYLPKTFKVQDILPAMAQLAGLDPKTPLEAYEEIKWEPTVMVEELEPDKLLYQGAQLESGDIVCFQKAVPKLPPGAAAAAQDGMEMEGAADQQQQLAQQQQQILGGQQQQLAPEVMQQLAQQPHAELLQCRYPRVPQYLSYIFNRKLVTFKKLEDPKEPGFQLELLRDYDYHMVAAALAAKLGLQTPTHLRLTQQNAYSNAPQRAPIKYGAPNIASPQLANMLTHTAHSTDVLFYEVLDMPLPLLEQLKSLKVHFYNEKVEYVGEHLVRLPKDRCVADLLDDMRSRVGKEYEDKQLRLVEVYKSIMYKVVATDAEIEQIDGNYWQLRVEPVPADEQELPPGHRIIQVVHITTKQSADTAAAAANNNTADTAAATQAINGGGGGFAAAGTPAAPALSFGDPFLLRIAPDETVGQVKARIQEKLGTAAAGFETWKAVIVAARPEYLSDDEILTARFPGAEGRVADFSAVYLGLEHEDKGGAKRPPSTNRYTYERPVKIYN